MNLKQLTRAVGNRTVQLIFLNDASKEECTAKVQALKGVSMGVKV